MNILHVTREKPDEQRYGIGRSLEPILSALSDRGHRVLKLTPDQLSDEKQFIMHRWQNRAINLPGIRGNPARRVLAYLLAEHLCMGWQAALFAHSHGFEIIHHHNCFLALGQMLAQATRAVRPLPFGFTQHSFCCTTEAIHRFVCPLPNWLYRRFVQIERLVCLRTRWLIAPTYTGLQRLASELELECIPHGHCLLHPIIRPKLPDRTFVRKSLGWHDDIVYVLAIGTIIPLKRLNRIVKACAASRFASRLQLMILGHGDEDSLRAEAIRCQLARPPIITVADDIWPLLVAADVYLSASATESFGMANLEALCAGLPAVVTAVDAVPEVVGDAALLTDGSVDALTKSLDRILENPHLAESLRQKGLARCAGWPRPTDQAVKLEAIYTTK